MCFTEGVSAAIPWIIGVAQSFVTPIQNSKPTFARLHFIEWQSFFPATVAGVFNHREFGTG
jgi:hypothetical protein